MTAETAQPIDFQEDRFRAVKDVNLLLEFLGQRADSRLQAHFEDTRGGLTAPIGKLAAPPCRTSDIPAFPQSAGRDRRAIAGFARRCSLNRDGTRHDL